jgi:hypothetical protein
MSSQDQPSKVNVGEVSTWSEIGRRIVELRKRIDQLQDDHQNNLWELYVDRHINRAEWVKLNYGLQAEMDAAVEELAYVLYNNLRRIEAGAFHPATEQSKAARDSFVGKENYSEVVEFFLCGMDHIGRLGPIAILPGLVRKLMNAGMEYRASDRHGGHEGDQQAAIKGYDPQDSPTPLTDEEEVMLRRILGMPWLRDRV